MYLYKQIRFVKLYFYAGGFPPFMQNTTSRYIIPFFLTFTVGTFLYFEINYRYWSYFMEQYGLFLYKPAYFIRFLKQPGGLSGYMAEFLTQFFCLPYMASLIFSLLIGGSSWLFYLFVKRCGGKIFLPLILLPAGMFWIFPLESIASVVAIFISLVLVNGYTWIRQPVGRYIAGTIGITFAYYLFAPSYLFITLLLSIYEFSIHSKRKYLTGFCWLVYSLLLPLISLRFFYILPVREVFFSRHLFHPEFSIPTSFYWIWFSFSSIAIVLRLMGNIRVSFLKEKYLYPFSWIVLVGFICLALMYGKNPLEQAYRYDYYARSEQWDKIVEHALQNGVKDLSSQRYVNLALSYEGRLNDCLFSFQQSGLEGLIPSDPKTRLELIQASEVAWHLNHTNSSQRFAFVGVLSAERCIQPRLMKRLIETYLVNEEYRLAEKYIKILESSLFYKEWAQSQRSVLDPEIADSVAWIRQKRGWNPVHDNIYDLTKAFPVSLAYLLDDHPENKPAFDYAMVYVLLYKDFQTFMYYMEQLKEAGNSFPVLYQEALCLYFAAIHRDPETFRSYPIDTKVYERFRTFLTSVNRLSPEAIYEQYGDTYYYYAQFVTTPKELF